MVGASVYYGGGSNLKNPKPEDEIQDVSGLSTTMFDLHASYDNGPFSAYGVYTQTNLDGAEKLGESAVKKASGYYANASYDLGGVVGINYKMPVFAQYENYNPVERTVDGLNEETFQTEIVTIGMKFFPCRPGCNQGRLSNERRTMAKRQISFSLGLGFIF